MKTFRNLVFRMWALLALGIYLIYCAAVQYSPLPSTFASIREADQYAWHLKFPWIGLGFCGGTSDQTGQTVRMYTVEYLFREKDRVFVIANEDGVFRVIDEFTSAPQVYSVELRNSKLRYFSYTGKLVTERDARVAKAKL